MKEKNIIRGLLAGAIIASGIQFSKSTEAQTPPVSGEQSNVLFIPYVAFEKIGSGIIFPPSTPTPPEVIYDVPKVTPRMNSCNDNTPGRKLSDVEVEISSAPDYQFPPIGFRSVGVASSPEGLSETTRNYVIFNMDGKRRTIITPEMKGTYIADQPTPTAQAGKTYYAAIGEHNANGYLVFDKKGFTAFIFPSCPPKN